jgi:hypothetical protein
MALYDYELYLVRHQQPVALATELFDAHLLEPGSDSEAHLPSGGLVDWSDSIHPLPSGGELEVMSMELQPSAIEPILRSNPGAFIDWLWDVAGRTQLLHAFMPSGSDAADAKVGNTVRQALAQLDELVTGGRIRIAHPLMFFSKVLGDGQICAVAANAPLYTTDIRQDIGCLLLLADGDLRAGPVDMLDPGIMYGRLRQYFETAKPAERRQ